MKKLHLLIACIVIIFTFFNTNAQRGIGTNTPSSSAILELKSTTKGFLPPRLSITEIESIVSPAEGLIFYCTDCDVKGLFFFDGSSFIGFVDGLGLSPLKDASTAVLAQIGLEAGSGSSNITIAQLDVILPSLTDVKYGNQSFYRVYIGSNPNEFASPATKKEVQNAITHVNGNLNIPTVSGQKGTVWMDRNLGATQVATSSTDHLSYGNLYQWGRRPDGHEVIVWTSSTGSDGAEQSNEIGTQSSSSTPVHDDFITSTLDWTTSTATLWQVVNGENNPCPTGFRIPTSTELDNERAVFSTQDYNGAFNSVLKLPVAGFRSYRGLLYYVGSRGRYWSSTVYGTKASSIDFYSSGAFVTSNYRAYGSSVRCIKD